MTKRLVIPSESLADVNRYTGEYDVRYRIISEDRNRFSYWSPIYSVDPELKYIPNEDAIEKFNTYVTVIWDAAQIYKITTGATTVFIQELDKYDLWVRWGRSQPGDWIYKERLSNTSVSLIIPQTYTNNGSVVLGEKPNKLSIEIYRPGRPILRDIRSKETTINHATAINITTDVITYAADTQYAAGDIVVYLSSTPASPLVNDTEYYVRPVSLNQFTLHPTRTDAINDTNKINFTVTPTGTGTFYQDDFLLYRLSNESV